MPSKNIVRTDLNHLRKLNKSIRLFEAALVDGGSHPLPEQLSKLQAKRDKILEKYSDGINALSPEESLIFTLYYLEGKTQKQVAKKTNYCKSSITKHLSVILGKFE